MNTTLNQLNIFIVLGIAADDIFVFCDAWRQSLLIKAIADNEHRRMAYTFNRAFKAIAVTSSTTAVAFLANTVSDIRPIRAFGIYAAIIIPVNFFIVILVMPSIQILHDRYFKDRFQYRKLLICCPKKAINKADTIPKKDTMSLIIGTYYNTAIFKARYVIIVVFFSLGILASITAFKIEPLTEQEEYLPDTDPMVQLQKEVTDFFYSKQYLSSVSGNDQGAIYVHLNWGIKDLDRSEVGLWDPKNMGKLVLDDSFTIGPVRN